MIRTRPLRTAAVTAAFASLALTGCSGSERAGTSPGAPGMEASAPLAATGVMPAPLLSFDGLGQGFVGKDGTFTVTTAPPSPVGDVGPNHYVQAVNSSWAVFDKAGRSLLGPVTLASLFANTGTRCATSLDGSPTVLYDALADRWVISQTSVFDASGALASPFYLCVAVSQTPDPTGAWFAYSFAYTSLPDRPRMSLWPDGYYVTFDTFNAMGTSFLGPKVCALDRTAMLGGTAPAQQCFTLGPSYFGLQPADLDGSILPPAGAPIPVVSLDTAASLGVWKLHVDWAAPANSTFTGPTSLPITSFARACGGNYCIPQLGTTNRLDPLPDMLSSRLVYRRFPDGHQSLVTNHSIASGGSVAIRWYELQLNAAGTPSVVQEGTHAPDATFRWSGSIAQDQVGNLALGYATSSATMKPSIAYAGHLAADPPGQLGLGEATVLAGAGAQTGTLHRWGEISTMSLDPVDECTFWYTAEYLPADGTFNWRTRIASFTMPGCAPPDFGVTASPATLTVQQGVPGTVSLSTAVTAGVPATVDLVAAVSPAGVGVLASVTPASVVAGGGAVVTVNASGKAAPGVYLVTVTGTGSGKSHVATVDVTVTVPSDFTISAAPATLTLQQGGSATSTVSTTALVGAGTVGLTAAVSPAGAGVTADVTPGSVAAGGSATLTVTTTAAATPGSYTVTVTGTEGAATHATTVGVTVTAAPLPDFSISAAPATLTLQQGGSATSTVSTTALVGAGTVGLTAAVSPAGAGVTADVTPGSVAAGGSATLTVTTTAAATPGSYTVTVTGTEGTATHATTVGVTVTAAPLPDFSISAAPATLTLQQGSSATSTVSTTALVGTGTVGLTAAVSPAGAGVTADTMPGSVTAGGTATLTVTTSAAATPGNYTVTVTGTEGTATHATTVGVTVTAAPVTGPPPGQGGGCSSSGGDPTGGLAFGLLLLVLRRSWRPGRDGGRP